MTARQVIGQSSEIEGQSGSEGLAHAGTAISSPAPRAPHSTLIHRPASYFERLNMAQLFQTERPLEVEFGSGDGSFLAQYAGTHPERNFVGVERLLGRLRKLDRKGLRGNLTNLRLLRIEAFYCLEYLLPVESVQALHIYFPDPWPKRRHHKNRLVNTRFTEVSRQALRLGGIVFLRTDDPDYFRQMTEVYQSNPHFQVVETPATLLNIVTDFERDFNAKGIPTLRAAYERRS